MNLTNKEKTSYRALREEAQSLLELRNYKTADLELRLKTQGVEARELVGLEKDLEAWIPGVEVFSRKIHRQRNRGHFGELARFNQGILKKIGFAPQQWASAVMFPQTAKGFHIHPPYLPKGEDPKAWFQKLYKESPENYTDRPYAMEQWDLMFFVQGNVEMFLVDERQGLTRNKMRFFIDGDDCPSDNNVGVVIPAGVAHALRSEGSRDVIMVYGTSTSFCPEFEGRIASEVESINLDQGWKKYFT